MKIDSPILSRNLQRIKLCFIASVCVKQSVFSDLCKLSLYTMHCAIIIVITILFLLYFQIIVIELVGCSVTIVK